MAMMGSGKPTLRDMAATSESSPSSQRAPNLGASAVAMDPLPTSSLTRANRMSPSTNGCRYNPEVGLGTLATFVDPAAAHLRTTEPVCAGVRGILEVNSDLCCNGYCTTPYCVRQKPFRIAEFMLSCNLCRQRIGGGPLYMYKGEMVFCKPECRDDYAMQELYKERQKRASAPASKRVRRAKAEGKAPEGNDDEAKGRMFFTYAEVP